MTMNVSKQQKYDCSQISEIGHADFREDKLQLCRVFQQTSLESSSNSTLTCLTLRECLDQLMRKVGKTPSEREKMAKIKLLKLPTQTQDVQCSQPTHFAHIPKKKLFLTLKEKCFLKL